MPLDVKVLDVMYNGTLLGRLKALDDGDISFQYDSEWIKNGFSISPFSLPLINKVFINTKKNFDGLYGVFYDSLPNGWGELVARRELLKRGYNYDRLSPLTKLALLSQDSLGGLNYVPSLNEDTDSNMVDLDALAEEMKELFEGIDISGTTLDSIYQHGGSSGGARPKAHIKIDNIDYIVKFPSSIDPMDIGKKEYEANELASQAGINAEKYLLLPSRECKGYFATLRFDRKDSKRVHVISLSSLLETSHQIPNLDYLHLVSVIKQISKNVNEDLKEAYRRMVFNTLLPNKDDHGKNFSFIYDEDIGGYRLSPMYDITKTTDKLEHEMTVNGNGNPTVNDLFNISNEFNLTNSEAQEIIKQISLLLR